MKELYGLRADLLAVIQKKSRTPIKGVDGSTFQHLDVVNKVFNKYVYRMDIT